MIYRTRVEYADHYMRFKRYTLYSINERSDIKLCKLKTTNNSSRAETVQCPEKRL